MKIAIAQLNYTIGDVEGNTSKIIDSIQKAKERKADLVIFAEQAVSRNPRLRPAAEDDLPRAMRGCAGYHRLLL